VAATLIAAPGSVNRRQTLPAGKKATYCHCLTPIAHGIFPDLLGDKPANTQNNNGEKL